jgi:hypothetical protein
MDQDITQLVEELREGKIDGVQFTSKLDDVLDTAVQKVRQSPDSESAESEHIAELARKAARL